MEVLNKVAVYVSNNLLLVAFRYESINFMYKLFWLWSRSDIRKIYINRYVCGDESIDSTKIRMILDESFSSSAIPGSKRIPIIDTTPVSCWQDGPFEVLYNMIVSK